MSNTESKTTELEESKSINYKIHDIRDFNVGKIFLGINTGEEIDDLFEKYKKEAQPAMESAKAAEEEMQDLIDGVKGEELRASIKTEFENYKKEFKTYHSSYTSEISREEAIMENDIKSWMMKRAAADRRRRIDFFKELEEIVSQVEGSLWELCLKGYTLYKKQDLFDECQEIPTRNQKYIDMAENAVCEEEESEIQIEKFKTPYEEEENEIKKENSATSMEQVMRAAVEAGLDEYYEAAKKINEINESQIDSLNFLRESLYKEKLYDMCIFLYQWYRFFIKLAYNFRQVVDRKKIFETERKADLYGIGGITLVRGYFYSWMKAGDKVHTLGNYTPAS